MDKVNYIVIFDSLFDRFYLKLIVQHHFKNSFGDVFIDDLESSCDWEGDSSKCGFFLVLVSVSSLVVGVNDVMKLFGFRVLNKILKGIGFQTIFTGKLFVNEKFFKAIRYVTLSFAVVNSKRRIDTDFVSFFFVGPVGHELEDVFFGEFFSEFDFEGPDARGRAIDRAADVILGVDVFKNDPVPETNVLAPFFHDHRLELLFLCFGSLQFFLFPLLVHFVVDFERRGRQYFKERLPVVGDVQSFIGSLVQVLVV